MTMQIATWAPKNHQVKYSRTEYSDQEVKDALDFVQKSRPNATKDVDQDVFVGITKRKDNGREVAYVGKETSQSVLMLENRRSGLDYLLRDVADVFESGEWKKAAL